MVFGGRDRQLGPFMQDCGCGGPGSALKLGFNTPRKGWPAIAVEHVVRALGVKVFCVEEKTVHVKETGADWGKSRRKVRIYE
jgi:hypothetical protein